jgi:hypothetical protein
MPKLKVSLSIGYTNAKHEEVIEIPDAEWAECRTAEYQDDLINDYAQQWAANYIDIGARIIE